MSGKDRVDPKLLAPGQKPEDVIDYTDEEIKELIEKCYPLRDKLNERKITDD
tara:strand:+ start:153 stop:308 length:156 start_codon:yes stop_codon:yes gene_type:complete